METKDQYVAALSVELGIDQKGVRNTVTLLQKGGTIPFIARYRKEMTGSLDEVEIAAIRDNLLRYEELEKRKSSILKSLKERELLTYELQKNVISADSLTLLEDIYLPFKPKKRTRAMIAREKGLEPLAILILKGGEYTKIAKAICSKEENIATIDEAFAGARDIVAENISENITIRNRLRDLFKKEAVVKSVVIKKRKDEAIKFRDYFDWQESVQKISGHRVLALFRGETMKFLRLSLRPDPEKGVELIRRHILGQKLENTQLLLAIEESYSRLLAPSLENELRKELKTKADSEAIEVFSNNLKELLLAPPLGQKTVMALDPGYRTGAKLVCLDQQGTLLHTTTIFPTLGENEKLQAADVVCRLVKKYVIEAIGIGNGTAGRETENFIRSLSLPGDPVITLVNEDGASIYSASEIARREFPDQDITVRGAVSIGRRLQDPLAELVKIDPKSIGVGQYQHDVHQTALKKSLEDVVMSCVNSVGVEVNSASVELLSYVAGLGDTLAANIVAYRRENGFIASRKKLLKVKRLGAKAFEQCGGFLRIRDSSEPLDNSGVHPERYDLVKKIASDNGVTVAELLTSASARRKIQLKDYIDENIGMATLSDIMDELAGPGRDPRAAFTQFKFDESIQSIEDLREGMILNAIITNVTKFGAFVDIGIKQNGLIHISQMADHFIKDPAEVVRVRQQVEVKVLEVDKKRERIGLSLLI